MDDNLINTRLNDAHSRAGAALATAFVTVLGKSESVNMQLSEVFF